MGCFLGPWFSKSFTRETCVADPHTENGKDPTVVWQRPPQAQYQSRSVAV